MTCRDKRSVRSLFAYVKIVRPLAVSSAFLEPLERRTKSLLPSPLVSSEMKEERENIRITIGCAYARRNLYVSNLDDKLLAAASRLPDCVKYREMIHASSCARTKRNPSRDTHMRISVSIDVRVRVHDDILAVFSGNGLS